MHRQWPWGLCMLSNFRPVQQQYCKTALSLPEVQVSRITFRKYSHADMSRPVQRVMGPWQINGRLDRSRLSAWEPLEVLGPCSESSGTCTQNPVICSGKGKGAGMVLEPR
jgi:hypothetical protein